MALFFLSYLSCLLHHRQYMYWSRLIHGLLNQGIAIFMAYASDGDYTETPLYLSFFTLGFLVRITSKRKPSLFRSFSTLYSLFRFPGPVTNFVNNEEVCLLFFCFPSCNLRLWSGGGNDWKVKRMSKTKRKKARIKRKTQQKRQKRGYKVESAEPKAWGVMAIAT